ncbi:hypothetical protein BH10BAC3_BH10BAC3_29510 [soil metagenome]
MKKTVLIFLMALCCNAGFSQFDYYATAVYLNKNGNSSFYNTSSPGIGQDIGTNTFQGTNLGSFGKNSGDLQIAGAEIKTFKSVTANVCSSTVFFTVYPAGQRPAAPVYTSVGLGFFANCTEPSCESFSNSFALDKGGGCCSIGDQKWQFPGGGNGGGNDGNIDITNQEPGNYTLEIYYQVTGQNEGSGCGESKYDNNNSAPANYIASFTITAPLAVNFGNIQAVSEPTGNRINWNTFTEQNSNSFIIERSANGQQFLPIGSIKAAGNTTSIKQYIYIDSRPLRDANYYRVKMVETNGSKHYSAIVMAASSGSNKALLYPNPAKDIVHVYNVLRGSNIRISNAAGVIFYTAFTGEQTSSINVHNLPPGRYMLQVTNGRNITSLPLIINR